MISPRTSPLPVGLIARLRTFVAREGYYRAATHFSLSPATLARAIAGGRLYRGSRVLIEQGLAARGPTVNRAKGETPWPTT